MRAFSGLALALLALGAMVQIGSDGRHPGGLWSLLCPVLGLAGVALLAPTRRLWLALPLPAVAVAVGAALGVPGDPVGVFIVMVLVTVIACALWPVGIAIGRRARRRRAVTGVGVVLLTGALAVPAVTVAGARHIVRVDRERPQLIDLRAGSYRGIRLGMTRAQLEREHGPGSPGPDYISAMPEMSVYLRYGPHLVVALDRSERVTQMEVTDRQAVTIRGVGVGDSLRLWARTYGAADCSDEEIGSDWPTPYPRCDVSGSGAIQLHASGSYENIGVPAGMVVLHVSSYALPPLERRR